LLILNIIFGFINLFSISGYEFFYIHSKKFSGPESLQLLRQVYNLRVVQAFVLFISTNGLAAYCHFYRDPVLAKLLVITSFLFLISLISKAEETKLTKDLNYKVISISRFVGDLFASISICGFLF